MPANDPRSTDPRPGDSPATPGDTTRIPSDDTPIGLPVPITVWRLADSDEDQPATQPGAGFEARLARRLVLVYTRRGDTIIDLDHDIHVRHATIAAARSYVSLTHPAQPANLDTIPGPVSLVVFRWPRHTATATAAVADLLTACRLIVNGEGCLIAAIRPANPDDAAIGFAEHHRTLAAAAEAAGFIHVLQIVAVSAAGVGDQFLYYATRTQAQAARQPSRPRPEDPVYHIDLLVFTASIPADSEIPTNSSRDYEGSLPRSRTRESGGSR